jgi:hypothetical protein
MSLLEKQKNQGVVQVAGKHRLSLSEIAVTGGAGRIRDVSNALWFPAGQPISPVAPRGTPPRRYAYTPMSNINWTYRDGQVDFRTLRNFSYYPIVRDIIETVKDLLLPIRYEFTLKPQDEDEQPASIKKRIKKDTRLPLLRKFFAKPDGVLAFPQWLRGIYDDMLVIDAASIWKQRDQAGKICSLIQIDGGQVFPLISETGMQPAADGDNGAQKFLVQTDLRKASKEYLAKKTVYDKTRQGGSPAFQLTPYGFPAQQMTADELTYALYNRLSYRRYGFSKVEVCLAYIALGLGRLDFQAAFYRSGNMPEGIAFLPPDVPVGRVEELNKYLDTILAGQMQNRRKIIFLPSYGAEKQPNLIFPKINEQVLKDEFDDMIVRYLCHCFGLDVSSFVKKQSSIGGASHEQAQQQAQRNEALAPIICWTKTFLDGIIQDDLGFTDIEVKSQLETDLDEQKQSQIGLNELENGGITLDEFRAKRGYDLIGEEWSQVPLVKTANGYVRVDGLPMPGQLLAIERGGTGNLATGFGYGQPVDQDETVQ